MHILDFVLLRVVLVSVLVNAYVNGLDNQTNILCTKVCPWKDAMISCLLEGGIPLNHDDIKNVNLSEKINLTVWTAEYTAISNQTRNSSTGLDLLRDTICGSQKIHIDKGHWGSVIDKVTNIKYKNCTEQQAYVCKNEDNTNQWQVYLNETTWRNSETSCESKSQRLPTAIQLQNGNYIPAVLPGQSESFNLDVWIGLVASLDRRTVHSKTETGNLQGVHTVKHGTYVNSAGFRMIDEYLPDEFTALCSFESLKSVRQSLFTDCLKDTSSLHVTSTSLAIISTNEITQKTPEDTLTSNKDAPWLVFGVIVSCSILIVIISESFVIWFYKKRRPEELRPDDGAIANNGSGNYDYARGEDFNVATNESRDWGANSLACEPGVPETHTVSNPVYELQQLPTPSVPDDDVYDNTDGRKKERSQEGQVELHIYDRANYSNGESLYDNRM